MKLKITIPWWLRPWHEVRGLRESNLSYLESIGLLEAENRVLARHKAELARQLDVSVRAQAGPGRAVLGYEQAGGAKPEFAIVGIDRGAAGGKRIYVSRDLGGASFGIQEVTDLGGSTFHLNTAMAKLLVIDEPNFGAAMQRMAQIWASWDKNENKAIAP